MLLNFNIALSVKRHINGFYVCKKYHGQYFEEFRIKSLFGYRKTYSSTLRKFTSSVYGDDGIWKGYLIKKCHLVDRAHALSFLDDGKRNHFGRNLTHLYQLMHNHLVGTSLYIFYEDKVPFWKIPDFRPKEEWLPKDIEEYHINEGVKNRDQVIEYLKFVKAKYK